jgi:hypothetical protein
MERSSLEEYTLDESFLLENIAEMSGYGFAILSGNICKIQFLE